MQVVTAKSQPGRVALVFFVVIVSLLSVGSVNGQGFTLLSKGLASPDEMPMAGIFVLDNLAFIGGLSQGYNSYDNLGIRILDLSDLENPTLVGRIPLRTEYPWGSHTIGSAVAGKIDTPDFKGTIAVVLNGVPDEVSTSEYPEPYGVWDVSDPANPTYLSVFGEGRSPHNTNGDLGDYPFLATALAGTLFFYAYDSAPRRQDERDKISMRLGIADLSDPYNPVSLASWQESPDVSILGVSTNPSGTRVYLSTVWPKPFGTAATHVQLYILDTSDPANPTKLGKWQMRERDAGKSISSAFIARSTRNDSLVVFADGSFAEDSLGHGIIEFLDTSDPSNITKISEFDAWEPFFNKSTRCVNLTIRGTTLYSAWLRYGVVAVDISDPRNPRQYANYQSSFTFFADAVPMGETTVLGGTIWGKVSVGSAVYVLRDEAVVGRGTAVEGVPELPGNVALRQNYPNPFTRSTEISFELDKGGLVRLSVFDLLGREVRRLTDSRLNAGVHEVRLELDGLPGGVYLYRLDAEGYSMTRRATLIK